MMGDIQGDGMVGGLTKIGRGAALAVLLLASAAPVTSLPTAAQAQPSGYYRVEFCNRTNEKVYLAVSYVETPGSKDWIVEGWKNINAGACIQLDFAKGNYYYYYAENDGDGYWGGDDFELCVQRPGPFRRINRSSYTCDGDDLMGFVARDPGDKTFITENLRY